MLEIPFGETSTYGEIVKRIERETGERVSAQAVGGAVGHNTFAIIVSCHRVFGSKKSLTGYAGGIDKKIEFLKIEGINEILCFCWQSLILWWMAVGTAWYFGTNKIQNSVKNFELGQNLSHLSQIIW